MRSNSFYSLLLAVCLFNGTANRVIAQVASSSLAPKVNALFAEWNKPGSPGVAVGVVHRGKLVYAQGFGEADVETGARIGSQTIFHAASLAKQFTAYAIVLLARQRKLSLDDDIRTYVPEVPDVGKKITIRHLIHHTSGLRDQWALLTMAGWRMDDVITKEHIFNLLRRQKELNFEPGSEFAYSNTNYTLLAEVVSRVGQQPFPDWMHRNVFGPLGMSNTFFTMITNALSRTEPTRFTKTLANLKRYTGKVCSAMPIPEQPVCSPPYPTWQNGWLHSKMLVKGMQPQWDKCCSGAG
jgi:CubicO group peptidase (beta-lactamase class C family)